MPPEKHALLSASSASRWLVCTAAPRFEEGLPERTSEYAEEGRLAHAIGELKVLKKFMVRRCLPPPVPTALVLRLPPPLPRLPLFPAPRRPGTPPEALTPSLVSLCIPQR